MRSQAAPTLWAPSWARWTTRPPCAGCGSARPPRRTAAAPLHQPPHSLLTASSSLSAPGATAPLALGALALRRRLSRWELPHKLSRGGEVGTLRAFSERVYRVDHKGKRAMAVEADGAWTATDDLEARSTHTRRRPRATACAGV